MKAYVAGISTYVENEDMEFRYRIYKDNELLVEKKGFKKYEKPLVVSHFALLALLKEFKKMPQEDMEIIIHDAALYEQLRRTSTTKNKDVLKVADLLRSEIEKFPVKISIIDVTGDFEAKTKWDLEVSF